jgi:hypothetical protein
MCVVEFYDGGGVGREVDQCVRLARENISVIGSVPIVAETKKL